MTVVLASTNRVQLSYIAEANFGVLPVSGTPKYLRVTGETLDFNLTKENDKEINANADLTSVTTTNAAAGGDIKVHVQYGEHDPFLAGVMRSAWAPYGTNGVGTTFTATVTTTTITASAAPTGLNAFTTLQPGQWFSVLAPGALNNGKLFRVSTTTAPTSTVITLDISTVGIAETAVAGYTISSSRVSNGVSLTSFSIQREVAEVGNYFMLTGMYPSKFSTSFASAQLTEGTYTFMGKSVVRNTSTTMPNTPTASLAYDIQNAVTGVGNVWEAGVPLSGTFIKSMSLDIDSGLRAQDAIGNLGMVGAGIGTFMAKGTLEVYFSNGALYDKFINDVYTSITLSTTDSLGNGYVFTFPKVQLTSAKVQAGSKDADLMASFEYTAYRDQANTVPALRKSLFIDRVGAAVLP